jgi:hypothetical protein
MTLRRPTILTCLAAVILGAAVAAQPVPAVPDKLADYLTPDGNLRSPLEVRDEKKGFGTFAGTVYRVEPGGQWSITRIIRNQLIPDNQGLLTKTELRKLAGALLEFDMLTLPSAGRPLVNPHVMTISYGPRQAVLTFGVDQVATRPNANDPAPDVVGRFGGIANAVRGLLRATDPQGIPVGR